MNTHKIIALLIVSMLVFAQASSTYSQNEQPPVTFPVVQAIGVQSVSYAYQRLHEIVSLAPDGRGATVLEHWLKSTGTSYITSLGWRFNWPSGDFSNIYAFDDFGPLTTTTSRGQGYIDVYVNFRGLGIAPGAVHHFSLGITIGARAFVSGNAGRAYWYIYPGVPVDNFMERITFPSNATFTSISPTPTSQSGKTLVWESANHPADWSFFVDVLYTLASLPEPPPFLDLPINYDGYSFDRAASGNFGKTPGKVNSWVDHRYPNYWEDGEITTWKGNSLPDPVGKDCTFGLNCYDGHDGIDFQHDYSQSNEPIYAAAAGVVVEVCTDRKAPPCTRYGGYGTYILINHRNGYATLYAHLARVNTSIQPGIEVQQRQPIAIMGNTGTKPIHLHFMLYYDPRPNPTWPKETVVDPYGWSRAETDPATAAPTFYPRSRYLWKHPLGDQQQMTINGGQLATPSNSVRVNVPAGALPSLLTLNLLSAPPEAAPSAQLTSVGYSFWLRVLEWLTGSSLDTLTMGTTANSFAAPVTLTVGYQSTEVEHLDESRLAIYRWNDAAKSWEPLPTTVDAVNNQATALTTQPGSFDLQGPLMCPSDQGEMDDGQDGAKPLAKDGSFIQKSFDSASDQDWFVLDAIGSGKYQVRTSNLASNVDTVLYLFDQQGNLLAYDDDGGGGRSSSFVWSAPSSGLYFVTVVPYPGSAVGCSATYSISTTEEVQLLYLPLISR